MNQMKKEELEITISDSDRIECAIRHIQTAVDVDLWARKIAVEAMEKEISALQEQDSPKPKAESVQNVQKEDLISRKAAIDAVEHITSSMSVCVNTDECHGMKRMQRQAVIELANLPSAQPEPCDDAVSRKAVLDLIADYDLSMGQVVNCIHALPSVTPKRKTGKWTKDCACEICGFKPWYERDIHTLSFCPNCGADMREETDAI